MSFINYSWAHIGKCLFSIDRSTMEQRSLKPQPVWWTSGFIRVPYRTVMNWGWPQSSYLTKESHPARMKTSFKRWKCPISVTLLQHLYSRTPEAMCSWCRVHYHWEGTQGGVARLLGDGFMALHTPSSRSKCQLNAKSYWVSQLLWQRW